MSKAIEGFESPYGLELLATVHWVAAEQDLSELDTIAERVRAWSSRKADLFTDNHITVAWERLRSLAWVRLPKSD